MKILIAEKRHDITKKLESILTSENHEVLLINNSQEVIDNIYVFNPELVILSLQLTKPAGLNILKKLLNTPSTWNIPIIVLAKRNAQKRLAEAFKYGAFDYIYSPVFKEELLIRLNNVKRLYEGILKIEGILDKDYLTGLYSRKFFMSRAKDELLWASNYHEPLSVLMLDIDYFKKINDTYGHSCGDVVLKKVAQLMQSVLRKSDVLARLGGEEFIALLPNTDEKTAFALAESLRIAVSKELFVCEDEGYDFFVTISIGIYAYTDTHQCISLDYIMSRADKALYDAKNTGRNKVAIFQQNRKDVQLFKCEDTLF